MAGMNSGYANERELARAIAAAKAKSKYKMNAGYANELELANAIKAAKAKKKATPKPTPSGSRTVTKAATTPRPRATKKATPTPKPKPKVTKGPTQRQMLDVPNMTPAQKIAYLRQQQRNAY